MFNEEVNKIARVLAMMKKIQTIDSIETYAYGKSKDLVCKREEIKCSNIRKQYKNDYLRLRYNRKHKRRQSKLATKFLIIHTEY